ncbi:MAG: MarR family transcriptional regulator [Candidatus Peribacteraceae bacterium]|jgi:DNA-binding MarR family transcriptional regulator
METPSDAIIRYSFGLTRVIRHMMICLQEEGITVNFLQIHALALIEDHPGMTMKELADVLHVASPSATSFVNRLVRSKLVSRSHDAKNRKLVRLTLTKEGKVTLREKRTKRTALLKEHLHLLTREEQRQLANILKKLHTSASLAAIH